MMFGIILGPLGGINKKKRNESKAENSYSIDSQGVTPMLTLDHWMRALGVDLILMVFSLFPALVELG